MSDNLFINTKKAAIENDLDTIKRNVPLLMKRTEGSNGTFELFMVACKLDRVGVVKILIDNNNIIKNNSSYLSTAARYGSEDIVDVLIKYYSGKDRDNEDVIISAVQSENINVIKKLMPYACKRSISKAMHISILYSSNTQIVDVLFEYADKDYVYNKLKSKYQTQELISNYDEDNSISYFFNKYDSMQTSKVLNENMANIKLNKKIKPNKIM